MSETPIVVSARSARRLALQKQRLWTPLPRRSGKPAILSVVRDLAYVQWDPVNIVAPSHEILLWSRIGEFRPTDLADLLWKDRRLFQGWGHSASILPTEDYAFHYSIMRRYPESLSKSWGSWKAHARRWLPRHATLRRAVLRELARGPRTLAGFPGHAETRPSGGGWGNESDVSAMLFHLWLGGEAMIVGHEGRENLWGSTREFLPSWAERVERPAEEVEYWGAQRAVRSLPFLTRSEIQFYFPRGRYLDLPKTLDRLEADGRLRRAVVEGVGGRGPRYVHADDLATLERLAEDRREPRTSLLPPFDNLITCRDWMQRLFHFEYIHENFLPAAKRRYGLYVLPIVHGDEFVGRIDPKMDRTHHRLIVNAVHAEPGSARDRHLGAAVDDVIQRLAHFLGAEEVRYGRRVPEAWRTALR